MKILDLKQGSPEWFLARRGIPTASNFGKIITPKTGKLSAQAEDLAYELVADLFRLGPPEDKPVTPAMLYGQETEAEARRWYELERGLDVRQVGLCLTDDGRFGCSPDGLVGEDGGLELKCPLLKTQVKYLCEGGLPDEYRAQVHGALIVTGRAWWDFCSYAPGLPAHLVRVEPDTFTDALRRVLDEFRGIYDRVLAKVRGM